MKTFNKSIFCLFYLLALLLLEQCTEKINIKLDNNQPHLVVEGMVTNEATVKTIRLSTTTDYFYTRVAPAVTQAIVTLNDDKSTVTLIENPANSGIYTTPSVYTGIPGTKYTLHIELQSAFGGEKTFTASETMPGAYSPDSIKMLYHADWGKSGMWETQLFLQDPPDVNFYSFRAFRNDTLVTDTLSNVRISDDKFYNNRYVRGMPTIFWNQEHPSEKINVGDKIRLQVGSITKTYYTFLDELRQEVNPKNPLFSGPSANVSTNISNGAYGYFSVCAVSDVSTTAKK